MLSSLQRLGVDFQRPILQEVILTYTTIKFSYTRLRPARKDATNRNLLRQSFIAYIFRSQRARKQECKSKSKREKKNKNKKARESKKARKRTRTKSKRKNGKTLCLLRRIILRLGRITPWLAAAHRPSCHHEKCRTHGGKTAPARVQIMFTT